MATSDVTRPARSRSSVGVFALLVTLAVAGIAGLVSGFGQLKIAVIIVLGLTLGAAAAAVARRSFAWFISAALVLRPVVDLTAGQGIGIPEVMGVGVLLIGLGWLVDPPGGAGATSARAADAPGDRVGCRRGVVDAQQPAPDGVDPDRDRHRGRRRRLPGAGRAAHDRPDVGRPPDRHPRGQRRRAGVFPLLGLAGVQVSHQKDGIAALKSVFFLSNNFGHFLVPFLLAVFAMATQAKGRARLAPLRTGGGPRVELLQTETRGAWIAALVGILVVGAVLDRRLLIGALVAPLLLVAFVPSVSERVTSTLPDPGDARAESSLTWRFEHWVEVLPMVKSRRSRASGSTRRNVAPASNRTTTSCSSSSRWAWSASSSTSGSSAPPYSPASARPSA